MSLQQPKVVIKSWIVTFTKGIFLNPMVEKFVNFHVPETLVILLW